ncbi:MAG: M23 family metallopeptidase [Spirosomataceae bacterium]
MLKSVFLLLSFVSVQADSSDTKFSNYPQIFTEYKQLLVDIRENRETPESGRKRFQDVIHALRSVYPNYHYDSTNVNIVFPLRGFDYRAVGGRGSGYRPKGYDLFDNTKKGSHPAHDIFIKDKDQDDTDDRTLSYIDVLSVSDGVVLATETNWQKGSEYRGGNYVWVYDFNTSGLWYYAHQRKVLVQPGQIVRAGQKLAEVGRTGFNAAMPRSDTHLHLTYLRLDEDGNPYPVNTYGWLQNAENFLDPRIAVDLDMIMPIRIIQFLKIRPFNLPKIR